MNAQTDFVRGLLVPCSEDRLLIPSATVAEVASYSVASAIHDAPAWLLGTITWRNVTIPVISPDHLLGKPEPDISLDTKLVVIYGLEGNAGLQFYAIVSQGVPHVLKLAPEMLGISEMPAIGSDSLKAAVTVEGSQALVPDFQQLENMLADHFVMRDSA